MTDLINKWKHDNLTRDLKMRLICITTIFIIPSLTAGCVNVEPTEREYLARNDMQLDPYYLDEKFRRHLFAAREATQGGYGVDSAGCGCN